MDCRICGVVMLLFGKKRIEVEGES